jgi:hypothetical protein
LQYQGISELLNWEPAHYRPANLKYIPDIQGEQERPPGFGGLLKIVVGIKVGLDDQVAERVGKVKVQPQRFNSEIVRDKPIEPTFPRRRIEKWEIAFPRYIG